MNDALIVTIRLAEGGEVGRPLRVLTPEGSARDRFGAELRAWRVERRLTHRELAALLWLSQELLAKIEKGERWPSSLRLAIRCDEVLATGGVLASLWPEVDRERQVADGRSRRRRVSVPSGGVAS